MAISLTETPDEIRINTAAISAVVHKKRYVTGVAGGTLLDRKSGFRDQGFGLDIVDWLMEPGSDESYRSELHGDMPYDFHNLIHGELPRRCIEGPQICTQAGELSPAATLTESFAAVTTSYRYPNAAPGKRAGSEWRQTLVFPDDCRYFFSSDRVITINESEALLLRLDMPGHIRHSQGDTFSEIYLSYAGRIPSGEFFEDFAPDDRFRYHRDNSSIPSRFIRAYHLRDPSSGMDGPWLAGMTLNPGIVYEAWCHQRGYVCMIEEIGGHPVQPGESFSAAFIVGYFESIEEMNDTYDRYSGATGIELDAHSWRHSGYRQGDPLTEG